MSSTLDHAAVRWEVIEEDGQVKVRPEHASVDQALIRIGAANPFVAFAITQPNARELAQQMVEQHNAALKG